MKPTAQEVNQCALAYGPKSFPDGIRRALETFQAIRGDVVKISLVSGAIAAVNHIGPGLSEAATRAVAYEALKSAGLYRKPPASPAP